MSYLQQSFYIYSNGELKQKDNTIRFLTEDGEKKDIPIERVSELYIMSEMRLNTNFLNFISRYGITVHFFNYYSFYTGSFYPKETLLAGNLLVKQVEQKKD